LWTRVCDSRIENKCHAQHPGPEGAHITRRAIGKTAILFCLPYGIHSCKTEI